MHGLDKSDFAAIVRLRRHEMDRDTNDDILNLIDLGIASVETQGIGFGGQDRVGQLNTAMLSDDD